MLHNGVFPNSVFSIFSILSVLFFMPRKALAMFPVPSNTFDFICMYNDLISVSVLLAVGD